MGEDDTAAAPDAATWARYPPGVSAQEKSASRPEPAREPAPEVQARVQVERPRCPYCHDPVAPGGDEAHGCGGCLAWQHRACWEEHGACGACGRAAAAGAAAVGAPTKPGQGLSLDSLQQVKTHLRLFARLSLIYAAQITLFAWLQLWPVVALLLVVGVVSGAIFWRGAMRSLHERDAAEGATGRRAAK